MGLIVLVLDHWPWRKPESSACFSCQNLQGKAATIRAQSHLRHQSARQERAPPSTPARVQLKRGGRGDDLRPGCHGEEDGEQTDVRGQVAAHRGPSCKLRDGEEPPPAAFLLAAHPLSTYR